MSDDPRRLTTDEARERFHAAVVRGGLCAGCGRGLGTDDAVYIEPIAIALKPLTAPGAGWSRETVRRDAPLGWECTSPAFLARVAGREPERCAGCGRPVYYAKERAARHRATCSRRCVPRAGGA
jgi:hypothetical protein